MSLSIKQKIIARVFALCEPLKTTVTPPFRAIERTRSLFLLAAVKPALHVVIGDENKIEEDVFGYTMEFPIAFKVIVEDARSVEDVSDAAVAFLQTKIEGDPQLNGGSGALANSVKYDGELPFTEEVTKPAGGAVVMYVVQYRRKIAQPEQNY